MEQEFKIQDKTYKLKIESKGNSYQIDLNGKQYNVNAEAISSNTISLLLDGRALTAHLAEKDDKVYVSINGENFCVERPEEKSKKNFIGEHTHIGEKNFVSTPMPGKIVKISVKAGDEVRKNQTLVIVEAMKMENEIKSPTPAKVKKINFKEGDLVDTGQPIVELEPIG
jgi:biotin carboxyl carrier protein